MQLESMIVSKIIQTQNIKYHIISYLYIIKYTFSHKNIHMWNLKEFIRYLHWALLVFIVLVQMFSLSLLCWLSRSRSSEYVCSYSGYEHSLKKESILTHSNKHYCAKPCMLYLHFDNKSLSSWTTCNRCLKKLRVSMGF